MTDNQTLEAITPEGQVDKLIKELIPVDLKNWVDAFVFRLVELFDSQADQHFETAGKNPAKFEYSINMDIWNIALKHFDFVQLLRDKFDRSDINVELVVSHGRRVLEVTIPWYDY